MQPLNDDELRSLLRQWDAPPTPHSLETRVLGAVAAPAWKRWLRWVVAGSIRVPAPVGIGVIVVILLLAAQSFRQRQSSPSQLSDFEAVKELKPRIVRSAYDTH